MARNTGDGFRRGSVSLSVALVSGVTRKENGPAAARSDSVRHRLKFGRSAGAQYDTGPFLREQFCANRANAAAGASDDDRLLFQFHGVSPSRYKPPLELAHAVADTRFQSCPDVKVSGFRC